VRNIGGILGCHHSNVIGLSIIEVPAVKGCRTY